MNPALSMWQMVLKDPVFRNMPFKIETNRNGSLLMAPASNWHGICQSQIGVSIRKARKGGEVINECSILTSEGVKVADVAWASDDFLKVHGYKTPYHIAPEICVEIVSLGNTNREIEEKVNLYLAKGAVEVWVISEDGKLGISTNAGSVVKSKYIKKIEVKKRF